MSLLRSKSVRRQLILLSIYTLVTLGWYFVETRVGRTRQLVRDVLISSGVENKQFDEVMDGFLNIEQSVDLFLMLVLLLVAVGVPWLSRRELPDDRVNTRI